MATLRVGRRQAEEVEILEELPGQKVLVRLKSTGKTATVPRQAVESAGERRRRRGHDTM